MPGIRRLAYKITTNEDSILCSKNINTNSIVPLFYISNVTNEGIDNLFSKNFFLARPL